MGADSPTDPLAELFDEYREWYLELAEEHGALPRSISGVTRNGEQFVYLLDDLELHHMARNKYLRFVLEEFDAVAYVYGGIDLRGDSDTVEVAEVLNIVAADAQRYLSGDWRVTRGEDGRVANLAHMETCRGDDPAEHPGSWFLTGSVRFSETEKTRFAALWNEAKSGVMFRERGGEG